MTKAAYLPRCLKCRCFSPIACAGFGYCRERNDLGLPTEEEAAEWRRLDKPTEAPEQRRTR